MCGNLALILKKNQIFNPGGQTSPKSVKTFFAGKSRQQCHIFVVCHKNVQIVMHFTDVKTVGLKHANIPF